MHVQKTNVIQGHAVHRELRGCSCQGLEQHHQDTTLKFSPAGPQPASGSGSYRSRTVLADGRAHNETPITAGLW